MNEISTLTPTMPGDRWAWAEKQLAKSRELVRVYSTIAGSHGPWLAHRLRLAEADVKYWQAELNRLRPHDLMIDRLYAGPGMRLVCRCGEWEAAGGPPFSLWEADAHELHRQHADGQL